MITYPVDPSLTFTVYSDTLGGPILDGKGRERRRIPWSQMSTDNTQMIQGLASDTHILQDVEAAQPAYDPLTHKLVRAATVYDVANETATDGWDVVALTQEEIDAAADNADRDAKLGNLSAAAVTTLRGWSTTAGNTTVTNGNAVAVLQQVVDNLAVFYDRFADLIEGQRIDK